MHVPLRACVALLAWAFVAAEYHENQCDDVVEILKVNNEIIRRILGVWQFLEEHLNLPKDSLIPQTVDETPLIIHQMMAISLHVEKLQINFEGIEKVVTMLTKSSGRTTRFELRLHELVDLLNRVESAHVQMLEYLQNSDQFEQMTLEDFAHWSVSHDQGSVRGLLERIHSLIRPPYKNHNSLLGMSILELVIMNLQVRFLFTYLCVFIISYNVRHRV